MRVLYYDCFAGISGDMNLGALLDLGVDEGHLREALSQLSIRDEFELSVSKRNKMGIEGTKVDVILKEHHHQGEHHHHHHRHLKDIREIINGSKLSNAVKQRSMAMFVEVAKAEAKVHGKTMDEIHFHEVGAVDAIVDMVGAAICLEYLQVDRVLASSIEVGSGFVKCAHGTIPVPAPATVEILKGIPINIGGIDGEATTPTGAAILKANVHEYSDKKQFQIMKIGYGVGTKDFAIPNVLRVYLAEDEKKCVADYVEDHQIILEANIDDMNPEWYGYIEEKLFEGGALDVTKTNILMKKGRPAVKLSVLTSKKQVELIKKILLLETTTLGVRQFDVKKIMLKRQLQKVETKFGPISVKQAIFNGEVIKQKPEYDECKKLAIKYNIPIRKVYEAVNNGGKDE
ncbi:nickel pincer cofactor biosynthesis protein LarC [Vallitalea okinawensis]|uniref:nickel pincer cofactor biosynthesis protein LarC n=1 Tax=Vallitalea okinawensis TaxID=2078660 RepID=UPI000CFD5959|nr:nickel pincer cofactor biosynthesis protein LarC [Vallitalea okinawensis]